MFVTGTTGKLIKKKTLGKGGGGGVGAIAWQALGENPKDHRRISARGSEDGSAHMLGLALQEKVSTSTTPIIL